MNIQKRKKDRKRWENRRRNSASRNNRRNSNKKKSVIDPYKLIKANGKANEAPAHKPVMAYRDLKLHNQLKANLAEKGYTMATEIQEASIQPLLEGRNMVAVANTGTGKTGAFLIPLIDRLLSGQKFNTLIVVPTRELAIQVEQEFRSLAHGTGLYSSCFIGGTNVGKDISKLKRRNDFIIGTPGRLLDMVNRGALNLRSLEVLILDEFDRMLDMGFVHDIKRLAAGMNNRRQTLLFSATTDPAQKALIAELVHNPVNIQAKAGGSASSHVEQHLIHVGEAEDKFELLVNLISGEAFEKVIVFAETKRMVDKLSKKLNKSGVAAGHIHGDKSQNYRNKAISQFRKGTTKVLVATDVAARGIDIDRVSHVVNYQLPLTEDSYVHRIGRTGRAGNRGSAYTFVESN